MSNEEIVKLKPKKKNNSNPGRVILSPAENNRLHACYDEYVMHCQQHHYIPPKFRYFVIEMAKDGFVAWQERTKKHA